VGAVGAQAFVRDNFVLHSATDGMTLLMDRGEVTGNVIGHSGQNGIELQNPEEHMGVVKGGFPLRY